MESRTNRQAPLRALLSLAFAAVAALSLFAAASQAALSENSPEEGEVAEKPAFTILNLASAFDDNNMGARVGYSLREKLRRSGRFTIPDELDIDQAQAAGTKDAAVLDIASARALAAKFDARYVAWGDVTHGDVYSISLQAIDLRGDGTVVTFKKTAETPREVALVCRDLADELAKALTGEGYSETYPSMSTSGYMKVGPNLVKNGHFESGTGSPAGWEPVDGLCSFRERGGAVGHYVRFDTDVDLAEWQEWRKKLDEGADVSQAPKKTPTSGDKYNTVAGTYGVHLYSDAMPVKPGATYAITFDAKGPKADKLFFAKVFVKGYGEAGSTMEYYNMYKAVKPSHDGIWEHYSRIFHPTERTPQVKFMKVMLYAYWPPGEYAFDNVQVYEVKSASELKAAAADSTAAAGSK